MYAKRGYGLYCTYTYSHDIYIFQDNVLKEVTISPSKFKMAEFINSVNVFEELTNDIIIIISNP